MILRIVLGLLLLTVGALQWQLILLRRVLQTRDAALAFTQRRLIELEHKIAKPESPVHWVSPGNTVTHLWPPSS